MNANKTRWSETETLKFVFLYYNNECLWNKNIAAYKSKKMRQRAIDSMVEQMGIHGFGASEAKTKIKNLRSTYNQELVKIRRSQMSGCPRSDVYVPNVKWFKTFHEIMTQIKGESGNQTDSVRNC